MRMASIPMQNQARPSRRDRADVVVGGCVAAGGRQGACAAAAVWQPRQGWQGAAWRATCRTACGLAQHAPSQARLRGSVPVAPVRGGEVAARHRVGQRLLVQLRELARRDVGQVAAACGKHVFPTTLTYPISVPLRWRGACLPPSRIPKNRQHISYMVYRHGRRAAAGGRGAGSPARPGRGAAAASAWSERA